MIPLTEESHEKQIECVINLIHKFNYHDMVYCDVGGCVGELLQHYCQLMKRGYVFEPNINNYEYLKNEYSDKGVVVENLAAHSYSGDTMFKSKKKQADLSEIKHYGWLGDHVGKLVRFREDLDGVEEDKYQLNRVSCITLDEYFKDKDIDFIKIDVEGAEWDVLRGAEKIMSEEKVIFQIEFHSDDDWENRYELIYDRGYNIYSLDFELLDKDCNRPYQVIISARDF